MFETSVIQSPPQAAGGRLSLLTASIIAHSAVIIGAVVVSVATVDFPAVAPDEFAQAPIFMPVTVPPPLGVENGGAVKQPEPVRPATPPPPVNQVTAPSTVPETVTPVATEATTASTSTEGVPGATSTERKGVPWGTEHSVGEPVSPPGMLEAPPVEDKIYLPHEVKAPVAIFKPAPPYPATLARIRMNATVVVRCIIDKNGHVRDPRVIAPASMAPFNDAVVTTVQRWRYTPGSLRGQAVESYLDVTVRFSVN